MSIKSQKQSIKISGEDIVAHMDETKNTISSFTDTLKDVAHLFDKRIDAVERLIEKQKNAILRDQEQIRHDTKKLKQEIEQVLTSDVSKKMPSIFEKYLGDLHPLVLLGLRSVSYIAGFFAICFLLLRLYDPGFFGTYRLGKEFSDLYPQIKRTLKMKEKRIEDLIQKLKKYESKNKKKAK